MVTPQSPPGTIYNSSPGRPSPGEVGARAVRILPLQLAPTSLSLKWPLARCGALWSQVNTSAEVPCAREQIQTTTRHFSMHAASGAPLAAKRLVCHFLWETVSFWLFPPSYLWSGAHATFSYPLHPLPHQQSLPGSNSGARSD